MNVIDAILDWLKGRGAPRRVPPRPRAQPVRDDRTDAGEYQLLYKYLRDRYANRVVLTFAEIEDLLGFSLPELARGQHTWWSGARADGSGASQSDAWTLAGRTATVNMVAQSVVFERPIALA